ncbi:ABC transporter, permease protein, MalFG family protein [Candidatus Vecturithrix granuli]|uniref:ABC transporter, permease protein, MalFG family protein n=1 Tax=Vecturithrix granuli TaxID=1499967 RepID=A0A081C2A4_VECG1|nr:ABC transporter, permease protein, MalFG family protein [Candidatus Vecturithrix granuli]
MHVRLKQQIIVIFSLLFLGLLVFAPFYWIFSASVKSPQEIISRTPTLFPQTFTLQHYDKLLSSSDYPTYLRNSVIVALWTMSITVVLSTLAAYGLYRIKFPGRQAIFRIILATYAFPGVLLLIPLYSFMSAIGLIDKLAALVIVNVTFAAPFAVWMLQAFFRTIPSDLEEAARLDGATLLQTLLKIILPLSAPGIASIAIFAFIMSWTEYMFASILVNSEASRTLPVGLAGIIGQYQIDWGLLLAGATLTTLPVILLFSFVGRHFVEGLTTGAVKS